YQNDLLWRALHQFFGECVNGLGENPGRDHDDHVCLQQQSHPQLPSQVLHTDRFRVLALNQPPAEVKMSALRDYIYLCPARERTTLSHSHWLEAQVQGYSDRKKLKRYSLGVRVRRCQVLVDLHQRGLEHRPKIGGNADTFDLR